MTRPSRGRVRAAATIGLKAIHKRLVYGAASMLLLSALPWFVATYGAAVVGLDERSARNIEVWALKAHGAAALLGLVALGSLLPQHVAWAWQAGRNRRSGTAILGLAIFLAVTGYLLYYGGEITRNLASTSHQIGGILAPAALLAHISLGRRRRAEAEIARRGAVGATTPAVPERRGAALAPGRGESPGSA